MLSKLQILTITRIEKLAKEAQDSIYRIDYDQIKGLIAAKMYEVEQLSNALLKEAADDKR